MSITEIEEQVRNLDIVFRLRSCIDRIERMCAASRPTLKTSIPVNWQDDDVFILTTLRDIDAHIKTLETDLIGEMARTALFEACLERALKLWQAAHPAAQFWPDGAENLAWVFDKVSALESEVIRLMHNGDALQRMAYNQGLQAGKIKDWVFLSKEPDNIPEDGQRVIVLYRHAGLEELVDAAEYHEGRGSALWWHTERNRAYDRSRDEILAWMPTPGVPFDLDGGGAGDKKERVRNCGHGAMQMVKAGDGWRCSVCGTLRAYIMGD